MDKSHATKRQTGFVILLISAAPAWALTIHHILNKCMFCFSLQGILSWIFINYSSHDSEPCSEVLSSSKLLKLLLWIYIYSTF